jgi:hypothetical protein
MFTPASTIGRSSPLGETARMTARTKVIRGVRRFSTATQLNDTPGC